MRFGMMNRVRGAAAVGACILLGMLTGCGGGGSSGSAESGTQVAGTFIDAPVEGLRYESTGWTPREKSREWMSITSSADGTKLVATSRLPTSTTTVGPSVYTSADSGASWTAHTPLAYKHDHPWTSIASSADGTKLAAASAGGRIYTSTDSGKTWTRRESDRVWTAIASSADGNTLVASQSGGIVSGNIFLSKDSGETWAKVLNKDAPVQSVTLSSDGKKLAAVADGVAEHYTSKIIRYANVSTNPTKEDDKLSGTINGQGQWTSIASSGDGAKLAAVIDNGIIYTSTDSGATWTKRAEGTNRKWRFITSSSDGTRLAAVAHDDHIYTSNDSGVTWTAHDSKRKWRSITSSADGKKLAAVASDGQIYTYTDDTSRLTTADGKYDCKTGQDVTFYLGNQKLGAVKCGEAVHVYHMAGSGDSVEKGVRVARLLQSLNTSTDSSKIKLPDLTGITVSVRLDTTDAEFEADVAALMTQVRNKGKVLVNTTPVTRADAVAHVQTELGKLSDTQKTNLCTANACNSELLEKLVKPTAVKVSVTGLKTGQGIVLKMTVNGSSNSLQLTGTTGTTLSAGFTTIPTSGQNYTVSGTASSSEFSCTYTNASGTYDPLNSPTVSIACSQNTRVNTTLSGTVTGLIAGQSVTLKNGVDSTATMQISSNGSFQWSPAIAAGSSYNLVVSEQSPSNLVCTLSNGSGTAPSDVYSPNTSTVSNMTVDCKVSGFSVSGTVTGLTSNNDSVGLILYPGTSNDNGTPVSVKGSSGGSTPYTFPNTTLASGSSFRFAIDGDSPDGYSCTVANYNNLTTITANVTNANVACIAKSSGGSGGGSGSSPTVTAVTPAGTVTVNTPTVFTITGTNLPTTVILVLGSVECTTSPGATSSGFTAMCTPTTAGTLQAQVKTNTAANGGTAIGNAYPITVVEPPSTPVTVNGPSDYAPGTVNGEVTNNGPDTRTILISNGANQVSEEVSSNSTVKFTLPGQLAAGVTYSVTASDVTVSPPSGSLRCTTSNGSGTMVPLPGAVSNVTVTCQLGGPSGPSGPSGPVPGSGQMPPM